MNFITPLQMGNTLVKPNPTRNKYDKDDMYIPPEIDDVDDDLEQILASQKPLKSGRKRNQAISKKRKLRDYFNLDTFKGQLMSIMRENEKWMMDGEIRSKLLLHYKEGSYMDHGFALQISTQMGQLWGERKVNRKGFPGSYKYKLSREFRELKSPSKKRKLNSESDKKESSRPRKGERTRENREEIFLHILRRGEYMELKDIYKEFCRLSHSVTMSRACIKIEALQQMLTEHPHIELKKHKKRKKGSRAPKLFEFRFVTPIEEEEEMPETRHKKEQQQQQVIEVQPPPPTTSRTTTTGLGFKCPMNVDEFHPMVEIKKMKVCDYVREVFKTNTNKLIDIGSLGTHMRFLKRSDLLETSNLRKDLKNAVHRLHITEKFLHKPGIACENKYSRNMIAPPFPNQWRHSEFLRKVVNIHPGHEMSSAKGLHDVSEKVMTCFLEVKVEDEDLLDDDCDEQQRQQEKLTISTQKAVLAIYDSEPYRNAKLRVLELMKSVGWNEFLKFEYYGRLNPHLRKNINSDHNKDIFVVIYESKDFNFKDLPEKFPTPRNMFDFIIEYLDAMLRLRRLGLIISPKLNSIFFDSQGSDICDLRFHIPLVNEGDKLVFGDQQETFSEDIRTEVLLNVQSIVFKFFMKAQSDGRSLDQGMISSFYSEAEKIKEWGIPKFVEFAKEERKKC